MATLNRLIRGPLRRAKIALERPGGAQGWDKTIDGDGEHQCLKIMVVTEIVHRHLYVQFLDNL